MKTKVIGFILLCHQFSFLESLAQMTITREYNMPLVGDVVNLNVVGGISCEGRGDKVAWDFTKLSISKEKRTVRFSTGLSGIRSVEPGVRRFYFEDGDMVFLNGIQSMLDSVTYSKPQIAMTFPMNYGDSIVSSFEGEGKYCETYALSQSGTQIIKADARGSILLPEDIRLSDVLQVHYLVSKQNQFEDVNPALTDTSVVKLDLEEVYCWYASGYRYPVFVYSISTCYADDEQVSSQTSAYCCLSDSIMNKLTSVEEEVFSYHDSGYDNNSSSEGTTEEIPFSYQLTQSGKIVMLSISSTAETTVNLVLASTMGVLYQNRTVVCQNDGQYELLFDCSAYPPGGYIIYINSNGNVVSEKFHTN